MSVFNEYLLLGNVWDVQSALLHKKLGFAAIGTSSGAIAASLGYEDGEDMPFAELVAVVTAIRAKVDLPLSVDIEGGYARDVVGIINNIKTLAALGIVGVNIEDSVVGQGVRRLLPEDEFAKTVADVKAEIPNGVFLNVRTDTYILAVENPLEATLVRAKKYELAGADGIFVPCITDLKDIKRVVSAVDLPLNVLAMPDLPDFERLQAVGVKRISVGNFIYDDVAKYFENKLQQVVAEQTFGAIFTA